MKSSGINWDGIRNILIFLLGMISFSFFIAAIIIRKQVLWFLFAISIAILLIVVLTIVTYKLICRCRKK